MCSRCVGKSLSTVKESCPKIYSAEETISYFCQKPAYEEEPYILQANGQVVDGEHQRLHGLQDILANHIAEVCSGLVVESLGVKELHLLEDRGLAYKSLVMAVAIART